MKGKRPRAAERKTGYNERPMANDDATLPFEKAAIGNELYQKAVDGVDRAVETALTETLTLIGSSPEALTPQEMGDILPEVERRLRLLTHEDQARRHIMRLRRIVLGWEES